jgi:hypothetical protein
LAKVCTNCYPQYSELELCPTCRAPSKLKKCYST